MTNISFTIQAKTSVGPILLSQSGAERVLQTSVTLSESLVYILQSGENLELVKYALFCFYGSSPCSCFRKKVVHVSFPLHLPNMPLQGSRQFVGYYGTRGRNASWNTAQLNCWGQDHRIRSSLCIPFLRGSSGSPAWYQDL